jgi:hypothetical protein
VGCLLSEILVIPREFNSGDEVRCKLEKKSTRETDRANGVVTSSLTRL